MLLRGLLGASALGDGGVVALLTPPPVEADLDDVQLVWSGACRDVSGAVPVGKSRKRIRFTKKTSVLGNPYAGHLGHPIPRRWKRLLVHGVSFGKGDAKRWRQASVLGERHGIG